MDPSEAEVVAEGPLGPGVDAEAARKSGGVVIFWGGPFSNFASCDIQLPGPDGQVRSYATTEHYFQAMKALDLDQHESIRIQPDARASKRAGREVDLRPDWDDQRFRVMLAALRAKFAGEPYRSLLLETGDRLIAEDSPYDSEWGIRARDGSWTGKNLLGRALMLVRSELNDQE